MVYIGRDGRVMQEPPLHTKLTNMFWGLMNFFYMFIVTMIPSLENRARAGGNLGVGGGDGRGPPRGGPPGPSQRRIGRINHATAPSPGCGPSGG